MVLRNAILRRRHEQHAQGRLQREHDRRRRAEPTALSRTIRRLLTGESITSDPAELGEFAELGLPDLLNPIPGEPPGLFKVLNLLDLAFLGRASTGKLGTEITTSSSP